MKPKERSYVDGVRDGLSIALNLLEDASSLSTAKPMVVAALKGAARAKDHDTLRKLGLDPERLLVSVP